MSQYPKIRLAIYSTIAAVLVVLRAFNLVSDDQSSAMLNAVVEILALLALVMAAKNVQTNGS